jgi:hypothetical protein
MNDFPDRNNTQMEYSFTDDEALSVSVKIRTVYFEGRSHLG